VVARGANRRWAPDGDMELQTLRDQQLTEQEMLAKCGELGYELVAVQGDGSTLYFKRPLESPALPSVE